MILILVDAQSKYIEAHVLNSRTTAATLVKLLQTFATHGIPVVIVSDNGTAFTHQKFRTLCDIIGIKDISSSPYHSSTTGLAEGTVHTTKGVEETQRKILKQDFTEFYVRHRLTPQTRQDRVQTKC